MDGAQEGRQSSAEHMEVAPADMDTLGKKQNKKTLKINKKTIPVPGLRYGMCVFKWRSLMTFIGSLDIT